MIRPVREADAPIIAEIYNYYIKHTAITFEEEPLTAADMAGRIKTISAAYPWLVWEEEGELPLGGGGPEGGLLGYAYAGKWKDRASYRFSVELSIYLRQGREGRGIGSALMARLLEELKNTSLNAVVSGITLPNERSAALHEKFGFEKVAHFREVGYKMEKWQDVGYWQLLLGAGSPPADRLRG